MPLSYTALKTFRDCHFRYHLRYDRIREAGEAIVKAVELPSLGEDEYQPLKNGEGKDNQPANPDSAG
jgi:hypothetical protein